MILPIEKNRPPVSQEKTAQTGCCGGAPVENSAACCKLDEEKKAEGDAGCGCGTSDRPAAQSSCC
ncbi:MAG: hypothetical protein K8S54_12365 [Spirochaetia bacterium]|nr:hypothetical protein [Spirochaetia bacterium]